MRTKYGCVAVMTCFTEHAGVGVPGDGPGQLLLPLHPAGEQHHPATEVGGRGQPLTQPGPATV